MEIKKGFFWLLIILVFAGILRLYQLEGYLQFLGDQGRDVLLVKRMIIDHDVTLLGPSASVGGFFTGPIYYYMMIPFLALANLNPVGPAILSVLFGLGTIVLIYILCSKFWNPRVGLIASFLVAINPKMVDISRYSWNPNPVPFFALATIILLYLASKRDRKVYSLCIGVCLGILYQLHYMDLPFIGIVGLSTLFIYPLKKWPKHALIAGAGFIFILLPFLLFEVLHGFPNTKSVIEFITRRGQTVAPRTDNFISLIFEMLRRLYEALLRNTGPVYLGALYFSLGALVIWIAKSVPQLKRRDVRIKVILLLLWIFLGAFGIGNYKGDLHDHYFIYLFPVPFILLGLAGSMLFKNNWTKPLFLIGLIILTYVQLMTLYFWQPPNNMLSQIRQIDEKILTFANNKPYNLALISDNNSDHAYRYFLEIWEKSPATIENPTIDPKRKSVTDTLVVICELKKCQLYGNSLWEIAGFGQAELVDSWQGPAGITVHKLIHYRGR